MYKPSERVAFRKKKREFVTKGKKKSFSANKKPNLLISPQNKKNDDAIRTWTKQSPSQIYLIGRLDIWLQTQGGLIWNSNINRFATSYSLLLVYLLRVSSFQGILLRFQLPLRIYISSDFMTRLVGKFRYLSSLCCLTISSALIVSSELLRAWYLFDNSEWNRNLFKSNSTLLVIDTIPLPVPENVKVSLSISADAWTNPWLFF